MGNLKRGFGGRFRERLGGLAEFGPGKNNPRRIERSGNSTQPWGGRPQNFGGGNLWPPQSNRDHPKNQPGGGVFDTGGEKINPAKHTKKGENPGGVQGAPKKKIRALQNGGKKKPPPKIALWGPRGGGPSPFGDKGRVFFTPEKKKGAPPRGGGEKKKRAPAKKNTTSFGGGEENPI